MCDEKRLEYRGFKIREMRREDVPQLARLAIEVFPRTRGMARVRAVIDWKFFRNPYGPITGTVIEDGDNQIVAALGSIPLPALIGGARDTLHMSVSLQVQPAHRRKGLLGELFAFEGEILRKKYGEPLAIGFPNPVTFDIGSRKFNYQKFSHIHRYQIPLNREGILRRLPRRTFLERAASKSLRVLNEAFPDGRFYHSSEDTGLTVRRSLHLPPEYDQFWLKATVQYPAIVVKDSLFMRWRFFEQPFSRNHFYEIRRGSELVGYFVLREDETMNVIDFLTLRERDLIKASLSELLRTASASKYSYNLLTFSIQFPEVEELFAAYRPQIVGYSPLVSIDFSDGGAQRMQTMLSAHTWHWSAAFWELG